MSLEFNRRSFLKYSAAAAVAVAGSSLLTGCGEDEYQKTGKIGSTHGTSVRGSRADIRQDLAASLEVDETFQEER